MDQTTQRQAWGAWCCLVRAFPKQLQSLPEIEQVDNTCLEKELKRKERTGIFATWRLYFLLSVAFCRFLSLSVVVCLLTGFIYPTGSLTLDRYNRQAPWYACCLFFAGRDSSKESCPAVNGVTISHLLRVANFGMVELFEKLKAVVVMRERMHGLPPVPDSLQEKITHLERKFCVLTVLFRKYEETFRILFDFDSAVITSARLQGNDPRAKLFVFGWTAYMLANNTMLVSHAATQWLILMYQLLLCCVAFIASRCPLELLGDVIREPLAVVRQSGEPQDVIEARCRQCIATFLELKDDFFCEVETANQLYWQPFLAKEEFARCMRLVNHKLLYLPSLCSCHLWWKPAVLASDNVRSHALLPCTRRGA